MKRKIAALLSVLLLLSGCGASVPPTEPEPSVSSGTIAYVPLDDRPDNLERVEYLAASLGYQLSISEEDLFQTRLDGQPRNENGTSYGDRAALYEWVLEQEAAGCDRYILSLDQLTSGGLVNSRHMTDSEPVTLSDGTVLTETELVSRLLEVLSTDPGNQVWLLDTVMRLAPTSGYAGLGLNEYNALRTYGIAARPTLTGSSLTVDQIVSDYPLSPDGTLIPLSSDEPLPKNALQNYLAARERKLRLSDQVQQILTQPEYSGFHLLIGIDDSSAEDSIQKNEIALLRQGLRTRADGTASDWLLSGVDDLAFKAVTRLYLDESSWQGASALVQYYGGTENQPACAYDYQPLTEIVQEHLDFFQLDTTTEEAFAAVEILVLTQPSDSTSPQDAFLALTEQLTACQKNGIPVILIDAGNGTYGSAFHDTLTKKVQLGQLLSYSGFLDMAIVTGTALSHGVARLAWLQNGNGNDPAANSAFQKTLVESVVLDFCYKNVVREELLTYVRNDLCGDPNNFYVPAIDLNAVQQKLSSGMEAAAAAVLKNFSHSNLLTSPNGDTAGWGSISLENWSFPWNRAFEVRMDIQCGTLTAPHRKLLFFWL